MMFKSCFHPAIRRGDITCTVRIWQRPHAKVGGHYRLGDGAIEVQRIQEIGFEALTPALARRSGFASLVELLKVAKHGPGERVFLIEFRYVEAPVTRAASESELPDENTMAALMAKLAAMDRRAVRPWTHATLQVIAAHPGERAADLAQRLQRQREELKADIRKLKALGLTLSLDVGYRLSPRGEAVVGKYAGAKRKQRSA